MRVLFLFISLLLSAFNCYEAITYYRAILTDPVSIAQCIVGTIAINILIYYHKLSKKRFSLNNRKTGPFVKMLNVILIIIYICVAWLSDASPTVAGINLVKLVAVELIIITLLMYLEQE